MLPIQLNRETSMSYFKAGVQYGDWDGTAAADDADHNHVSLQRYLDDNKLIQPDEFLIATSLWVGENHGKLGSVSVTAYLYKKAGGFDTVKAELDALQGAIPVRKVDIELTLEEYFVLFK